MGERITIEQLLDILSEELQDVGPVDDIATFFDSAAFNDSSELEYIEKIVSRINDITEE